MRFEITNLDSGITKVVLAGRLDKEGSVAVENSFNSGLNARKGAVVVDISAVEFIASVGMRLLVRGAKAQQFWRGKFVLFSPPSLVTEALGMAGIDQLVPIHSDFNAACQDVSTVLGN
jgi:anti-anti-sigma factor